MNKAAAVLFGTFVFLLTGLLCVKPVCSALISQAFLERAFTFRLMDVIDAQAGDAADLDAMIAVQDAVMELPQLDRIAGEYLDASARMTAGGGAFEKPEIQRELQHLNDNIIQMLNRRLGVELSGAEQMAVTAQLEEEEKEVLAILEELPSYLGNFGPEARYVLQAYAILTSPALLAAACAAVILSAFLLIWLAREQGRWLALMGTACLCAGILWEFPIPLAVRSVGRGLTNRLLGTTMDIDVTAFFAAGGVLIVLGVIVTAAKAVYGKARRSAKAAA